MSASVDEYEVVAWSCTKCGEPIVSRVHVVTVAEFFAGSLPEMEVSGCEHVEALLAELLEPGDDAL